MHAGMIGGSGRTAASMPLRRSATSAAAARLPCRSAQLRAPRRHHCAGSGAALQQQPRGRVRSLPGPNVPIEPTAGGAR